MKLGVVCVEFLSNAVIELDNEGERHAHRKGWQSPPMGGIQLGLAAHPQVCHWRHLWEQGHWRGAARDSEVHRPQ